MTRDQTFVIVGASRGRQGSSSAGASPVGDARLADPDVPLDELVGVQDGAT